MEVKGQKTADIEEQNYENGMIQTKMDGEDGLKIKVVMRRNEMRERAGVEQSTDTLRMVQDMGFSDSKEAAQLDAETLKKLKDPFMAQFVDVANGPMESAMKQTKKGSHLTGSPQSGSTLAGNTTNSNISPSEDRVSENDPSLVMNGQLFNNIKVFNHL